MWNKPKAAAAPLRDRLQRSRTDPLGRMLSGMEKLAANRHEQIMLLMDRRLELTVLYAVGDATGPCADHVKIGVSTRDAFAEEMRTMRKYRSAEVVTRFETIISGRGKAEMIKTALLAALEDRGLVHRSWRMSTEQMLASVVGRLAQTYRVPIMTREQAIALEHKTYDELAQELTGGI